MKRTKEGIAIIEGDTYLSADIEREGRLDVARSALLPLQQYIPEGGTVVDVGACLGDYTVTFSQFVGDHGTVHAFEPNMPVFECLFYNMRNYANVKPSFLALGAEQSTVDIIVDHHNIGASRLTWKDTPGSVLVTTLDFLAKDWNRVDFIKIDAEGYEPLILDGAWWTIQKYRPAMLLEINPWMLGKLGFTTEDIFSRLDKMHYSFPRVDVPHGDILCLPL